MKKRLVVELPYAGKQYFPWFSETRAFLKLDITDVKTLESGTLLWRGNTTLYLEEYEEQTEQAHKSA